MLTRRLSTHHYNTRRSSLASNTSNPVDLLLDPAAILPRTPSHSSPSHSSPSHLATDASQRHISSSEHTTADGEDELETEDDQLEQTPEKAASGSRRKVESPATAQSSKRRKVDSPNKISARSRKQDEPQGSRLSINVPPTGFAASRDSRDKSNGKAARLSKSTLDQMSPLFPFDYSKASPAMLDKIAETQQIQLQQEALIAERQREAAMAGSTSRDLRDRGSRGESRAEAGGRIASASAKKSGERLSIVPAAYKSESSQGGKPATAPQHHPSVSQQQRMPPAPHTGYPGPAPRSGHYALSMQQQQQHPPSQLPSPHYPHDSRRDMDRDSEADRHRAWEHAREQDRERDREREEWSARRDMERERERERHREGLEREYRHGPSSSRPASIGQPSSRAVVAPVAVPLQVPHGNGSAHDGRTIHSPYPLPEPNVPNGAAQLAASRQAFVQPYAQLFDHLHENRHLQSSLHDLFRRGDEFVKTQEKLAEEMAVHYRRSVDLLSTLQESVNSLQDMVKHEVSLAREDFNAEVAIWQRRYEDLNQRVKDRL